MDLVSKQEWLDWKSLRPTKQLVKSLFDTREDLKEYMVENKFTTEDDRRIVMGRCQALKDAIDYIIENFETLEKEEKDDLGSSLTSDRS